MGRPSRAKGSRWEREIARLLGWQRGRTFSGEPDVYSRYHVGSVKCRKHWPDYIEEAVADAVAKAAGTNKEPIVILVRSRVGAKPVILMAHLLDGWLAEHGQGGTA